MSELMEKDWSDIISIFWDLAVASLCCAVCGSLNLFISRRHLSNDPRFGVHMVRKLCHISVGLIVMLFWPMFRVVSIPLVVVCWEELSRALSRAFFMRKAIVGSFGKPRVDQRIKFLKRYKDTRELLKAGLGYVSTIAFVTVFHWRSLIAIAAICNLCAGDGVADIVGRRFGSWILPYNKNKSFMGTIGMSIAGFFTSILFMYYFSWLGYIQESPNMALGFLILSIASAVVESHPLSNIFDDNLTVPVASILIGTFLL